MWTLADIACALQVCKAWNSNALLLKTLLAKTQRRMVAAEQQLQQQAPRLLPRNVHEYPMRCARCDEHDYHDFQLVAGPWTSGEDGGPVGKPTCRRCAHMPAQRGEPYPLLELSASLLV